MCMKKSGIYCWTSPSGKKYIGQSVQLQRRKREFLNFDSFYTTRSETQILTPIDCARKKYNIPEYWKYEVLEYCSKDELNEREIYWINYFNTFIKGYNSTNGGDSPTEKSEESKRKAGETLRRKYASGELVVSEERKRKVSIAKKGKPLSPEAYARLKEIKKEYFANGGVSPFKGKHHSEESKRLLSLAHSGKTLTEGHKKKISESEKGDKNPFYGKHHSEETIKRLKAKNKSFKVIQIDKTSESVIATFDSCRDAERCTGCDHSGIKRCCDGVRKSAGGYIWKYA